MVAASSLPYIDLPDLPPAVTEVANLDFGVSKVGLRDALQVVALPKTRVSGGWVGGASGSAYAELEGATGVEPSSTVECHARSPSRLRRPISSCSAMMY